jgi:hypothetical protein
MVTIIGYLNVAGTALLSVRLYASDLSRKYRAFFYYLIFSTLQLGYMMRLSPVSRPYMDAYVVTEPIGWIFCALVVLELYSLVLADYQGLYTVGRWALIVAVTLALVASAVSLLVSTHGYQQESRRGGFSILTYYYLAERSVYLSLVVFLATILFVILQYPITLKRNIIVHSVVFSFYFLCNTVAYSVFSLGGWGEIQVKLVRYTLLAVTLGSLGAWLGLLNPAGETRKIRLRPAWMPGKEEQLVSQLNNLNAALLRATRK